MSNYFEYLLSCESAAGLLTEQHANIFNCYDLFTHSFGRYNQKTKPLCAGTNRYKGTWVWCRLEDGFSLPRRRTLDIKMSCTTLDYEILPFRCRYRILLISGALMPPAIRSAIEAGLRPSSSASLMISSFRFFIGLYRACRRLPPRTRS